MNADFHIKIYDMITPNADPAIWSCHVVEFPATVPALAAHPTAPYKVVLRFMSVQKPEDIIRHFSTRPMANEALKRDAKEYNSVSLILDCGFAEVVSKVKHIKHFEEGAKPTNPVL
ncbi:hypothetical protein RAB80_015858 [Fusarium oxysporum f. sp. vasinfectum]|uniref:Uncharacterized protein n=1 Tax=Fusarium oxysporum f. sp. vasinfectum 25433 TaxID=1089449 RepID=X0L7P1_FUSOX|nr:hypothetical protein FOTG_14724 [Fusarium oxysporum f. sp. vasinfectum 25433]KAK2668478.1 hypothetical protein RAB80_015858 [Fusarium oxysporum f. sp. vasinfectum]KAK2925869.1 hypothetical protein FoTM2_014238 [Fusarium oxysporum f. sp. vasinfectum]